MKIMFLLFFPFIMFAQDTMVVKMQDGKGNLVNIKVLGAPATVLPFTVGGITGAIAAPQTSGTMTVPMLNSVVTITPTGACTFNALVGIPGQRVTFIITTSGTTSFVMTWGTGFRKVGTLATGTVSARHFSVTFVCISPTMWQEQSRTTAQT